MGIIQGNVNVDSGGRGGMPTTPLEGEWPNIESTGTTTVSGTGNLSGMISGGGGKGGSASALLASVTREMWEDYKKRFFPLEEQLMGMTTYKDPSLMEREVEKGQGRVEATFGSLWDTAVRRASSYGQSWDAAQYQANLNAHRLDKTAALADAANRI